MSSHKKRKRFVGDAEFPYISHLMKYSGFLPLQFDNYDEMQSVSYINATLSLAFLGISILSFAVKIYAFFTEHHDFDNSLLYIFHSVSLIVLFQGISNNILMLLKIKKMSHIINIVKNVSEKFKLQTKTRNYLITTFSCVTLAFAFTLLNSITNQVMTAEGDDITHHCSIQAGIPKLLRTNFALCGINIFVQCAALFHCSLLSYLADVWVMSVTKALVKGIQNAKHELILLKNKCYNFTAEFFAWNTYYSELHLSIRRTADSFSLILFLNVACNSVLLCLSLYWTIIQLRHFDGVLIILPTLLVIVQFVRMALTAVEGSLFQFQV